MLGCWKWKEKMVQQGNIRKHKENTIGHEMKYQLSGWILFVVCAVFFIASCLKSQDILMVIGSVIFLFACMLFLIPLVIKLKKSQGND